MTYKLIKNPFTDKVDCVQLTNSTTNVVLIIPFDDQKLFDHYHNVNI